MDLEKPGPEKPGPPVDQRRRQPQESVQSEGCLAVAIRIPVRIVVLVLVVPVRMVWDALVVAGRFLNDTVLRPVGRALLWLGRALFVWPWVALWRYVAVPVAKGLAWLGNVLLVVPAVWCYRRVLTPVGHGISWVVRRIGAGLARLLGWIGAGLAWVYARLLTPVGHGTAAWLLKGIGTVLAAIGIGVYTATAWLVRYLVVVPALWLYRWVLTPVGHGIAWAARTLVAGVVWTSRIVGIGLYWTLRVLLVLPALAVWRWVLAPVGRVLAVVAREVGDALVHAWRVAGYVSLAVGRFLGRLFRMIFVEPVLWMYRSVLTPVGHMVRDAVWRPAAAAAKSVGRATRQALASARESARQARAEFRRMLFGTPRKPEPDPLGQTRREPPAAATRTLERSTTALTKE
jgi:hypothetical protein